MGLAPAEVMIGQNLKDVLVLSLPMPKYSEGPMINRRVQQQVKDHKGHREVKFKLRDSVLVQAQTNIHENNIAESQKVANTNILPAPEKMLLE